MASFENQGVNTSVAFKGSGQSLAVQQLYGQTVGLFARLIKQYLTPRTEPYVLADIGSYKGELLGELLKELPEFKFHTIAVDVNADAIKHNNVADEKIVADSSIIPLKDGSVDVAICRYVIQWNPIEEQKKILGEFARIIKTVGILQHAGSDATQPKHLARLNELLSGEKIPKLERHHHHYSSKEEVEAWMKEQGIAYEVVQEQKIDSASDIFLERYQLTSQEEKDAKEILGDTNYFLQTTWVIFPKHS